MKIKVTGKMPDHTTREETRAVVCAAAMLLQYHNRELIADELAADTGLVRLSQIHVSVVSRIGPRQSQSDPALKVKKPAGDARPYLAKIRILREQVGRDDDEKKASFATVLIHEVLHLFADWERDEWTTSTLTANLKADVMGLAIILAANTYRRAAWLAHGKISYAKGGKDAYNDAQFEDDLQTQGVKVKPVNVVTGGVHIRTGKRGGAS